MGPGQRNTDKAKVAKAWVVSSYINMYDFKIHYYTRAEYHNYHNWHASIFHQSSVTIIINQDSKMENQAVNLFHLCMFSA